MRHVKLSPAEMISHMVEYGPIVAMDADLGIAITLNGAYMNAWTVYGDGEPVNFACRAMPGDLYVTTGAQMIDLAREYLNDIQAGDVDSDE